jgi:hypothetical protein
MQYRKMYQLTLNTFNKNYTQLLKMQTLRTDTTGIVDIFNILRFKTIKNRRFHLQLERK